eukprot:465806-Rhodomonas_salina.2
MTGSPLPAGLSSASIRLSIAGIRLAGILSSKGKIAVLHGQADWARIGACRQEDLDVGCEGGVERHPRLGVTHAATPATCPRPTGAARA